MKFWDCFLQNCSNCQSAYYFYCQLYLINGHNLFFYGFLGASARTLFSIFTIVYYNNSLFENAKNFDKYKLRKEKKINLIEKILSK